jgi:hypothetical protein
MSHDVTEDQLSFAPGVARVDESDDILALDESSKQLEAFFRSLDRLQIEMRRDHRQMRERPFAALDLELLWHRERQQMADCGRQHVVVAFEIVPVFREAAQHARDVVCNRGLFGDDEFLAGRRSVRDGGLFGSGLFFRGHQQLVIKISARRRFKRAPDDKNKNPPKQACALI